MRNDPVDHLLMSLYHEFDWGDPYEIFDHWDEKPDPGNSTTELPSTRETVVYMNANDMLQQKYHSRPKIENKDDICIFDFANAEYEKWPKNLFDLLGKYVTNKYDEEGKIYLYEDCINKVGLEYYNNIGYKVRKGRQFYINLVREIILWHELGHWIIHWMPGRGRNRWNIKSCIYNKKTKDIHEGLAQAFTQYAIMITGDNQLRSEYQQVFQYLLRNQDECYHKHYDIMTHPNFGWERMLNGLSMLRIREDPVDVTFKYLLNNMY